MAFRARAWSDKPELQLSKYRCLYAAGNRLQTCMCPVKNLVCRLLPVPRPVRPGRALARLLLACTGLNADVPGLFSPLLPGSSVGRALPAQQRACWS